MNFSYSTEFNKWKLNTAIAVGAATTIGTSAAGKFFESPSLRASSPRSTSYEFAPTFLRLVKSNRFASAIDAAAYADRKAAKEALGARLRSLRESAINSGMKTKSLDEISELVRKSR